MSFIKKKYRVEPGHRLWTDCKCSKCNTYRKQVIVDALIAQSLIEVCYGFSK